MLPFDCIEVDHDVVAFLDGTIYQLVSTGRKKVPHLPDGFFDLLFATSGRLTGFGVEYFWVRLQGSQVLFQKKM